MICCSSSAMFHPASISSSIFFSAQFFLFGFSLAFRNFLAPNCCFAAVMISLSRHSDYIANNCERNFPKGKKNCNPKMTFSLQRNFFSLICLFGVCIASLRVCSIDVKHFDSLPNSRKCNKEWINSCKKVHW